MIEMNFQQLDNSFVVDDINVTLMIPVFYLCCTFLMYINLITYRVFEKSFARILEYQN